MKVEELIKRLSVLPREYEIRYTDEDEYNASITEVTVDKKDMLVILS